MTSTVISNFSLLYFVGTVLLREAKNKFLTVGKIGFDLIFACRSMLAKVHSYPYDLT